MEELEIILVDDKSPDGSGAIADRLALDDRRIRVVHRLENGGLGPARNSGIDIAKGEYVMFVDSDDWIEPDMARALYEFSSSNNLDICFTGRQIVTDGVVVKQAPHPLAEAILSGMEVKKYHKELYGPLPVKGSRPAIPVSAWAALYRTDYLNSENLRFVNIRSEDMIFNIPAVNRANRIGFCSGIYYNYRKDHQPSITNTFSQDSIKGYFSLFEMLFKLIEEEPSGIREECALRANRRVIDLSRSALRACQHSSIDRQEKRAIAREMLGNPILQHALSSYPIWKMPLPQALFSQCMRARWVGGCELLAMARGDYA